jgi:hypothetical protein
LQRVEELHNFKIANILISANINYDSIEHYNNSSIATKYLVVTHTNDEIEHNFIQDNNVNKENAIDNSCKGIKQNKNLKNLWNWEFIKQCSSLLNT